MNIGFIGAGKVGCTIGKYLSEAGVTVTGYYSKTKESADTAATFTESESFNSQQELVESCDTIFITTPDGIIQEVWDCVDKYNLKDKVICHFSGSLSSDVFSGIETTGATCCSIHPMYAFCDKFTCYRQLNTACLTMEGQERALNEMKALFGDKMGHKIFTIDSKDKVKYHTAAAFASNYVVGIMQTALSLMNECGFSKGDAMTILGPIASGNIAAVIEKGTVNALTGPVERCDTGTVSKHLDAVAGTNAEAVYRSLGRELIAIAEIKNPNRDYTALKDIMYRNLTLNQEQISRKDKS